MYLITKLSYILFFYALRPKILFYVLSFIVLILKKE